MAWKKVLPMEERIRFVLEVEKDEMTVSELCHRYGVSRKTGYKWINRYRKYGLDGMRERSTRPYTCPHKTSFIWENRVVRKKLSHPNWGPKKIKELLLRDDNGGKVPASSTIGEILKRNGLVGKRKRRQLCNRVLNNSVLTHPVHPNQVWAADFKGWFRTGDGNRCEPLTVSDLYSRYVIEVRALPDQSYTRSRLVFESLFSEYGVPGVIRCDNGGPFASTGVAGLSRLSAWWIMLGIRPEYIAKGHPEQNCVHERMHLTLKKETTRPPAWNLRTQQRRFNKWRKEFNEQRPHESLNMKTPSQYYTYSDIKYKERSKRKVSYPKDYEVRRVKRSGEIRWKGKGRNIGYLLKGCSVGIKTVEPGKNQVYLDNILLGVLYDIDHTGLRPIESEKV